MHVGFFLKVKAAGCAGPYSEGVVRCGLTTLFNEKVQNSLVATPHLLERLK